MKDIGCQTTNSQFVNHFTSYMQLAKKEKKAQRTAKCKYSIIT